MYQKLWYVVMLCAATSVWGITQYEQNVQNLQVAITAYKTNVADEPALRAVISAYEQVYTAPQAILRAQADTALQKAGIGTIASLRGLAESYTELHRIETIQQEVVQEHAQALAAF